MGRLSDAASQGVEIVWRCESCETTIPQDSAFCPYCGQPVQREASPPLRRQANPRRSLLEGRTLSLPWDAWREQMAGAIHIIAALPLDRLVALFGGVLVMVGFLVAVAGGSGGYPWLGLGIAALVVSVLLALDRLRDGPP